MKYSRTWKCFALRCLKSNWISASNFSFPVLISPFLWNMCVHNESVYFKELYKQEDYWPTTIHTERGQLQCQLLLDKVWRGAAIYLFCNSLQLKVASLFPYLNGNRQIRRQRASCHVMVACPRSWKKRMCYLFYDGQLRSTINMLACSRIKHFSHSRKSEEVYILIDIFLFQ